jgi:acyl carrier protein
MDATGIELSIRNTVAVIGGLPEDADADADLYLDLGMASVHALALLQELEERFGVSIPDEQFVESTSIAKLTATLDSLLNRHV